MTVRNKNFSPYYAITGDRNNIPTKNTLTTENDEKMIKSVNGSKEENSPNDIEVINFYRRCLVHGNTNL